MEPGHVFERRVRLTPSDIVRFASDVGDTNPMHHDGAFAATTRFGGLIASGAHTVAIAMAMCGSQASRDTPGVGLDFDFRLLGAAKPDEEIVFRWEVVSVEPSERPRGTIVSLRGEAIAEGERPLLSATARTLLVEKL
ncbi:MAG: MaoC family dehydratase [Candidatus Eremiobacteraeota bacterium]|nr:MaoC family dehydratase [Candidatus Eremiobacteraeota bacterium]